MIEYKWESIIFTLDYLPKYGFIREKSEDREILPGWAIFLIVFFLALIIRSKSYVVYFLVKNNKKVRQEMAEQRLRKSDSEPDSKNIEDDCKIVEKSVSKIIKSF